MMLKPRDTAWRTGWRPHDCPQAGRPRLPHQALSVGRFCLRRGHAPLPTQVMCSSLHIQRHMTGEGELGPRLRRWNTVTFAPGDAFGAHGVSVRCLPPGRVQGVGSGTAEERAERRPSEWACLVWVKVFSASRPQRCSEGLLLPTHAPVPFNPGPHHRSRTHADTHSCYT